MASKTPVGFVGLGNMGSPMAKNLLKNGYPVIGTDVFPESCKELQDMGAQVMDTPGDVAEKADRIITMLPSSPNVTEVYTGPNGILKKVKKGTLLIDSSTIDPSVSKEMAVASEKMGAVFMDAPVSGELLCQYLVTATTALVSVGAAAPSAPLLPADYFVLRPTVPVVVKHCGISVVWTTTLLPTVPSPGATWRCLSAGVWNKPTEGSEITASDLLRSFYSLQTGQRL